MAIRAVSILAAALLAALPASAQSQQASSECRPMSQQAPRTRPLNRREQADSVRAAAVRQVRDTLRADVVETARRAGMAQPEGLVVMKLDNRRPDRAEVSLWAANVADSLVHGVLAARGDLVAILPERETVLHFRLDPERPGEGVADTTTVCAARLLNPRQLREEVVRAVIREAPRLPVGYNRQINVSVRMLVTREGTVAYAELSRRASQPALNDALLEAARRLLFAPARYQGVPMDTWVEQPVQIELPAPDPRRGRNRPGVF